MNSGPVLTDRQLAVLRVLADAVRPLCVAEVAERADLSSQVAGDILMEFWRRGWADRRWGDGSNESKRFYPITDRGRQVWRQAHRGRPDVAAAPVIPEWTVDCTASSGKPGQVWIRAIDGRVIVQPPPGFAFEFTGGQLADYRAALAAAGLEAGKELAQAAEEATGA